MMNEHETGLFGLPKMCESVSQSVSQSVFLSICLSTYELYVFYNVYT
jgi:hypothetical protein